MQKSLKLYISASILFLILASANSIESAATSETELRSYITQGQKFETSVSGRTFSVSEVRSRILPQAATLLGAASADEEAVKKAWRKLALKIHPDRNSEHKELADSAFKKIKNVYDRYNALSKAISTPAPPSTPSSSSHYTHTHEAARKAAEQKARRVQELRNHTYRIILDGQREFFKNRDPNDRDWRKHYTHWTDNFLKTHLTMPPEEIIALEKESFKADQKYGEHFFWNLEDDKLERLWQAYYKHKYLEQKDLHKLEETLKKERDNIGKERRRKADEEHFRFISGQWAR